jgi:GGDEF domain-containing protein
LNQVIIPKEGVMQTLSTQEHSGLLENWFGIPGVDTFYADVDAEIQSRSELLESLVLINIEVDNLEFILRNFVPAVRNELIKSICELISTTIPTGTKLYHISQFRFAVVAVNLPFDKVIKLTEELVESLEHAITIGSNILHAEIKIGISQYPNNADNIHELVRKAAFASYMA